MGGAGRELGRPQSRPSGYPARPCTLWSSDSGCCHLGPHSHGTHHSNHHQRWLSTQAAPQLMGPGSAFTATCKGKAVSMPCAHENLNSLRPRPRPEPLGHCCFPRAQTSPRLVAGLNKYLFNNLQSRGISPLYLAKELNRLWFNDILE